jgi:hypothetical protein
MRLGQLSSFQNRSSRESNSRGPSGAPTIYKGHSHFTQRALSRRGFLDLSAAASGLAFAGLAAPPLAHAAKESRLPNPIPGGLQPTRPRGSSLPFLSSQPND